MNLTQQILIACPLIFLAGFVDAAAGGGGLISLPAYYLVGLPPHMATGSNKFSSCVGTAFSTGRFLKDGSIEPRAAIPAALLALAGSFSGARLALVLSDHFLRAAMLVLLPVAAVFILLGKRRGQDICTYGDISKNRALLLSGCIGLLLGLYDGFFGPGTGTFLILAFTGILGFDYKTACGNTKVVNLSSNLAAVITFIAAGQIAYAVAVPAAVCSIVGHWIGSGLAIKKGAKFIRPVMLFVLSLLFVKITWDFLHP